MTISTFSAARTICDMKQWQISNLALQKIMYIAHMIHLGEHDEPLINETFEAWAFGPVVPSLYRKVSMFGSQQVKDVFYGTPLAEGGSFEQKSIEQSVRLTKPFSPGQLVQITHSSDGAWAKVYQKGQRNVSIPNEYVRD
jgi:uncharacterized phage-associated protein